jgi:predicted dehydrogenase
MTRIGIAGRFGRQGTRWAEMVESLGLTVSASLVRDPFGASSTIGAAEPPGQHWVTADTEMFLRECDRIIIATPVESHYDIAAAALRAGKPVLCEKPLAPTFQQAAQLYDTAARYWTRLWVCYPHLWHPAVEAMTKRTGPLDVEITFCGPTEREPLLDWGPHALSMALHLLGHDAAVVSRVISDDRKRVSLKLDSARGTAWVLFGWAAVKRVSVQVKNQPRLYYNNENCHPTTMQRMLAAWLRSEDDPRGDPALTLGVHEILEEVIR